MNCKYCNKECKNQNSLTQHQIRCKVNPDKIEITSNFIKYNQGVKEGEIDKKYKNGYVKAKMLGVEIPKMSEDTRQKISDASKNRKLSEETKEKISDAMKKAHSDGRAWNIGMSRWNNKPSYPETFFINVIENEFNNKNYIREYPFHKYSLDFAWVNQKKVIEIDGSQHQRFDEIKKRDNEKELLLLKEGWQLLRIKWSDIFNNPKYWINKSKKFIET